MGTRAVPLAGGGLRALRFLAPDAAAPPIGAPGVPLHGARRHALNREHLAAHADRVHIGSVLELSGPFDLIFHPFVLEHVSRPRAFLLHLFRLLTPGGIHLFSCPHYSVPCYRPPSLAHLGWGGRLVYHVRNFVRLLSGRPQFALIEDPAVFHLPWTRDRDAIHCTSARDIRALHAGRARISSFKVRSFSLKDRIVKDYLTLHFRIQKNRAPAVA